MNLQLIGSITGVSFSGWLGQTNARVGDYVEMAVMNREDHYVAYAMVLPALRTITMTPYCSHGREVDVSYEYQAGIFLIGGFFTILLFFIFILSNSLPLNDFFKLVAIFYSITAYACFHGVRKQRKISKPTTRLAEEIFTAIGFNEPQRVDLQKITKERLKQQTKAVPVVADRDMPSRGGIWADYLYYY